MIESNFDDWLKENGIFEECEEHAKKQVEKFLQDKKLKQQGAEL